MDSESFHDLALRVLAGEATPDDRVTLDREMNALSDRRADFESLQITHDAMRLALPMAAAATAAEPILPTHRVNELRAVVREHFGPEVVQRQAVSLLDILRWLFAGGGLAGLAAVVVVICFSNQTIEVGMYRGDLVRGGERVLSGQDLPTAKVVQFDQDAPFDVWQNRALAWTEHAKIWVDNEHDVLHIVKRVAHGQIVTTTQPLAPTDEGRREQIAAAVAELRR